MSGRQTREQIVDQLMRRTTEIMKRLAPLEVAQTLALHMSIDPQFLNTEATFVMQSMPKIQGVNLEAQIAQMFADIFLQPPCLEVTTSKASNGAIDGFVYPFGADRALFAIPLKLLSRSSPTAYSCLARLLNEPGQMPEGSSFASMRISSDNSTITYSQFQYNATFNAFYSRFSLVCALCTTLCGTARIAQANNTNSNDLKLMRVMVHGALALLEQRLLVGAEATAPANRNASEATIVAVGRLKAVCQSLATFNCDDLLKVAAAHYTELSRKHKIRVGV